MEKRPYKSLNCISLDLDILVFLYILNEYNVDKRKRTSDIRLRKTFSRHNYVHDDFLVSIYIVYLF